MPRYDQDKMVKLVSELRKNVACLRATRKRPFPAYLEDLDKVGSSKYHFWDIDDSQLYDILYSRLGDFKKFLDKMALFLEWKNLQ